MKYSVFATVTVLLFILNTTACSWHSDVDAIQSLAAMPAAEQCRFIAQAVGTGDGTLTGNASEDDAVYQEVEKQIKNIALQRGGNAVYMDKSASETDIGINGTMETVIVGRVYSCS